MVNFMKSQVGNKKECSLNQGCIMKFQEDFRSARFVNLTLIFFKRWEIKILLVQRRILYNPLTYGPIVSFVFAQKVYPPMKQLSRRDP